MTNNGTQSHNKAHYNLNVVITNTHEAATFEPSLIASATILVL